MTKHKTVTYPPMASPSALRLAAQLLVTVGELMTIIVCAASIMAIISRFIFGPELQGRDVPARRSPPKEWVCWTDRRYSEMSAPADHPPDGALPSLALLGDGHHGIVDVSTDGRRCAVDFTVGVVSTW
jgi:hypothetical protein